MSEGDGSGALRVRVRNNELQLSGLRVESADLAVAPAGYDRTTRSGDAYAEALKVRHLVRDNGQYVTLVLKLRSSINARVLYGYPSVHGAVFSNRKSYGPVRCGSPLNGFCHGAGPTPVGKTV